MLTMIDARGVMSVATDVLVLEGARITPHPPERTQARYAAPCGGIPGCIP